MNIQICSFENDINDYIKNYIFTNIITYKLKNETHYNIDAILYYESDKYSCCGIAKPDKDYIDNINNISIDNNYFLIQFENTLYVNMLFQNPREELLSKDFLFKKNLSLLMRLINNGAFKDKLKYMINLFNIDKNQIKYVSEYIEDNIFYSRLQDIKNDNMMSFYALCK